MSTVEFKITVAYDERIVSREDVIRYAENTFRDQVMPWIPPSNTVVWAVIE